MIDYRIVLKIQDKYSARLKRAYISRIKSAKSNTDWDNVVTAVPKGAEAVYNAIIWSNWHPMPILYDAYNEMYQRMDLKKEAIAIDASNFEMPNPQAERWLWAFAGKDVTEIIDQDRKMIRATLAEGMKNLQTYEQTANDLQRVIGLTESQARAVAKYTAKLRESGIKDTQIDKLAKKYASNLLYYRAETISLTETANATGRAQMDYYQEAERRGALPAQDYELYWLTTPDDRRCDQCAAMNGKTDEIMNGSVQGQSTPLHPRCRCVIQVKRK